MFAYTDSFIFKICLVVSVKYFINFRYGVKEISLQEDKVFISLSYSPKAVTLKQKFGHLPVRYLRSKLNKMEDFKILESIVKEYKFNLLDDEENVTTKAVTPGKRKLAIEEVYSSSSSSDDDDDHEQIKKPKKM